MSIYDCIATVLIIVTRLWLCSSGSSTPGRLVDALALILDSFMPFSLALGFDGMPREPMPAWRDLLKSAVVEFLAMLLFVYFGCGSAASNVQFVTHTGEWESSSVLLIAFAFGMSITVLVFATAHTSGGHINFAVTWALTLVGKCHPLRGLVYLVAQLVGSIAGAALLKGTTDGRYGGNILDRSGALGANGLQNSAVTTGNAFLAEVMGTLLLCFVVLETAVNSRAVTTDGDKMVLGNKQNLAPLPIGLAVFLAHIVLIPIDGCSINPTRSFGPSVVANSWNEHWIWWAGPLTGATIASSLWLLLKVIDWDGAVDFEKKRSADITYASAEKESHSATQENV